MTISNNPELNSRRASKGFTSLVYPENELLTKSTVLRFVEYQRNAPSDRATDETTVVIHLPLPQEIPENLQINSGQHNVGVLTQAASSVINGQSTLDSHTEAFSSFGDNIPKDIARAIALSSIATDDVRNTAGILSGVVRNPHTTAFFSGVELRRFNLSWNLSARSQQESDTINNIIQSLRERMLPSEDIEGFTLEYPDLVYVSFEGEAKKYLPTFYKSFISNMSINTSSGEGMVFYKSGAPVNVQINITFIETNILTREIISGE